MRKATILPPAEKIVAPKTNIMMMDVPREARWDVDVLPGGSGNDDFNTNIV